MTLPDAAAASPPGAGTPREASLLRALAPLIAHWRLLAGLPLAVGLGTAVVVLLVKPTYTATATFVPEASSDNVQLSGGLAGLAGQLGFELPTGGSQSGDFYAQVLVSRELLTQTLLSTFRDSVVGAPARDATLLAIRAPKGATPEKRLDNALRDFNDDVAVKIDRRSGLISLSVDEHRPQLAADVANRMVALVDEFNLKRRQSRSAAQRKFIGERLESVRQELRDVENSQLQFLVSNRRYRESPELSFQAERLARQVQIRQEVFLTLSRDYEQARIAEVKDTPLLTVVDHAVAPQRRTAPKRMLLVLLAMVAAACAAAAAVYVGEYRRAAREEQAIGYQEFAEAWRQFRREARLRRRPELDG